MLAVPAPIGHNSIPASAQIEADPAIVYREPGVLDQAIKEYEAWIASLEVDLITSKGRDDIKSRAADFSRLKVQIENAGLALTEEWRKKTADVNAVKTKAKTLLDRLRDAAREPLTKWEDAKKAREAQITRGLERIDALGSPNLGCSVADIELMLADLAAIALTEEMFADHLLIAEAKAQRAKDALTAALARAQADERDKAELARLRAEAAKREAEDRERAAKAQAEEAERLRKEQETAAAEARDRAIKDQAEREERERVALAARQKQEQEAAEKAEAERRARDFEHREKVKTAIIDSLVSEHGLVGNRAIATRIFDAIAEGKVPHVSIQF